MRGGSGGGGCSCCCGGDPPADESRSGLARSAAACASQSGEAGAADESCSGLARSAAARASQSGEAESLIGIDLNEVRYNDDDDLSETKRGETNQEIKAYRRSLKIRSSPGLDEAQRPQRVAGPGRFKLGGWDPLSLEILNDV